MKFQRVKVLCATFNPQEFLKKNAFPRVYSKDYNSLPFQYAGRQIDKENDVLKIYGYVQIHGIELPVVKTIPVDATRNSFLEIDYPNFVVEKLEQLGTALHNLGSRLFKKRPNTGAKPSANKVVPRIQMMKMEDIKKKRSEQSQSPAARLFRLPNKAYKPSYRANMANKNRLFFRKYISLKLRREYAMKRFKGQLSDYKIRPRRDSKSIFVPASLKSLAKPTPLPNSPSMCRSPSYYDIASEIKKECNMALPDMSPLPKKGLLDRMKNKLTKLLLPIRKKT